VVGFACYIGMKAGWGCAKRAKVKGGSGVSFDPLFVTIRRKTDTFFLLMILFRKISFPLY